MGPKPQVFQKKILNFRFCKNLRENGIERQWKTRLHYHHSGAISSFFAAEIRGASRVNSSH
jgi:hypothetical protein